MWNLVVTALIILNFTMRPPIFAQDRDAREAAARPQYHDLATRQAVQDKLGEVNQKIGKNQAEQSRLNSRQGQLATSMKMLGLDAEIEKLMRQEGYEDSLMNQENLDPLLYATLSSVVYKNFKEGVNFDNSNQLERRNLSAQIQTKEQTLADLADLKDRAREIIGRVPETQKEQDRLTRSLQNIGSALTRHGINISQDPDGLYARITSAIEVKEREVGASQDRLLKQRALLDDPLMNAVQTALDTNPLLSHLRVVGVFTRNKGEFSGLAAYDEEKNKLVLGFAGSKSRMDWFRNVMGWNGKSNLAGLDGLNFHAGILNHADNIDESSFRFANTWLKDMARKQRDEDLGVLDIVGTGHSLGGAIAQIVTAYVAQAAKTFGVKYRAGGVSFAAPNAVHSNSLERFESIFGGKANWLRFEHSKDPVPKVVFWKDSPGVSIQGDTSLFYDPYGTLEFTGRMPHGMDNYYQGAAKVFSDWKNKISQLFGFVTEHKKNQSQLEDLGIELDALNQQATAFSSFALNNATIGQIQAFAQLTAEAKTEADMRGAQLAARIAELRAQSQQEMEEIEGLTFEQLIARQVNTDSAEQTIEANRREIARLEKEQADYEAKSLFLAQQLEITRSDFERLMQDLARSAQVNQAAATDQAQSAAEDGQTEGDTSDEEPTEEQS